MKLAAAVVLAAALLAPACHGKGGPTTPVAADAKVTPGAGWTRTAPGEWTYDPGTDGPTTMNLNAPPPGRGIERIELPAGATGAEIAIIRTGVTSGGTYRWTAQAMSGAPIGAAETTATLDDAHGPGNPQWFDTALTGATVTGGFDLVFETVDGEPAVGAIDGERNVSFQAAPDEPAQLVPYTAYVRVVLSNVR